MLTHIWTHPYYQGEGDGPPVQHCTWCGCLKHNSSDSHPCPSRTNDLQPPEDYKLSMKRITATVPAAFRTFVVAHAEAEATGSEAVAIMHAANIASDLSAALEAESPETVARRLAGRLLEGPSCTEKVPCLGREEKRYLTPDEQRRGWTRRPFDAYVPDNMCLPCRAYWHVAMAANALDKWTAVQMRCAAEKAAAEGHS